MPVDDKAIHALRVDRRSNSSTLSDVHRAESFDRRSGISIPTFTAWPGLVGGRTFCRVRGADRPSAVPSTYRDVRMPALRRLRLRRSRMHPLRGADYFAEFVRGHGLHTFCLSGGRIAHRAARRRGSIVTD